MKIELDEEALRGELAPLLDEAAFRSGIDNLCRDRFLLSFFLMSVSQGEGLGEAAVGMIRQEEVAGLLRGLHRQELEERRHKEGTRDAARALFPEFFDGDRYRYEPALDGRSYYVAVLEANRAHLEQRDRHSRLNQYLTTTFGYEVMVLLLYARVARSVAASPLPEEIRRRVASVLEGILREEETHLGIVDQHNALLAADRSRLSAPARELLESLGKLTRDDYVFAADLSVRELVGRMGRYSDPTRIRAEIEAAAAR